jgi:hypothetical protein
MDEEGEFVTDEVDSSPMTDMDPYAGMGTFRAMIPSPILT